MLLMFEDGSPFAQGVSRYRSATDLQATPRILVNVQIEHIETMAAVDTGGIYLVCDPEIGDLLDLNPADGLETPPLLIRGRKVQGALHRMYLTLLAEQGKSLEVEITAFVPQLEPNEKWSLPTFMGLSGCLERIRFAVDPTTNRFYFGYIDEGD